jgi:hypothetical protein
MGRFAAKLEFFLGDWMNVEACLSVDFANYTWQASGGGSTRRVRCVGDSRSPGHMSCHLLAKSYKIVNGESI